MRMIKDALQKPEISFWVGLLVPLIGVAVSWGVITTRLDTLEERLNYFGDRFVDRQVAVDSRLDKRDEVLLDIQVTLGRIQTDLEYIKQAVK